MKKSQAILFVISIISGLVFAVSAEAKVFKNAYIAFELPDNWKCALEQTEWVCRSEFEKQAREAIIILTAKEVGPTDTFQAYEAHLNATHTVTSRQGKPIQSKRIYPAKSVKINDQVWMDGLHLGSEIPNYLTRYMATIKDRIAILVTFSAHKLHYTKYNADFLRAIKSMRVIASKSMLDRQDTAQVLRPGQETLGAPLGASLPADMGASSALPAEKKGGSSTKGLLFGVAFILAAIGAYIFWKNKKKK